MLFQDFSADQQVFRRKRWKGTEYLCRQQALQPKWPKGEKDRKRRWEQNECQLGWIIAGVWLCDVNGEGEEEKVKKMKQERWILSMQIKRYNKNMNGLTLHGRHPVEGELIIIQRDHHPKRRFCFDGAKQIESESK